jgi:hypothetical protein
VVQRKSQCLAFSGPRFDSRQDG